MDACEIARGGNPGHNALVRTGYALFWKYALPCCPPSAPSPIEGSVTPLPEE
jgi:hypothetical protein